MKMTDHEVKKRILVVDDETHILHVLSLKLVNAGFEVATALDGEEGLEIALSMRPDLIITDYQMPFMTGLELCERLRREPTTSHIPALMLTARGFGVSREDLSRTNIIEVLSKPFGPRDVLERVERLISGRPTTTAAQS